MSVRLSVCRGCNENIQFVRSAWQHIEDPEVLHVAKPAPLESYELRQLEQIIEGLQQVRDQAKAANGHNRDTISSYLVEYSLMFRRLAKAVDQNLY